MLKEIENIIDRMESDNIKFIRLQFVDLNGIPKSIAVPYVKDEMEDFFSEGMPFDGSSIEGFVEINDSDLILKPDISTYSQFYQHAILTLDVLSWIHNTRLL